MADRSIDDVISELGLVVDRCWTENSRLGYFPAMYRKVTIRIKEGVEAGEFQDAERMERLDVVFASRYLDALSLHREGRVPTRSWGYAFEQAARSDPSVLHHLLLGMNAHINLDLAIAAAQVSRGADIEDLQEDFVTVNDVLAGLVDEVQDAVDDSSNFYRIIDKLGGRFDEGAAAFSIGQARRGAWRMARSLHAVDDSGLDALVVELDSDTARIASAISPVIRLGGMLESMFDGDGPAEPRDIIDALTHDAD